MAAHSQVSQGSQVSLLAMNQDPCTSRAAQELGSLGCLKSRHMPVGVLTYASSLEVRTQLSKCTLCRCPRCCRASQMALGVNLWVTKSSLEEGIYLPL